MRNKNSIKHKDHTNEQGAAMVMALLMSFLLITASAGVLLSTSMNSANVTDMTAEQQAYSAAESGIQATVNILRYKCTAAVSPCKVAPSPLLDTTKPDFDRTNTITYVRALTTLTSNDPGDAAGNARLSRWMNYEGNAATDRVKMGDPGVTYDPLTGYAYSVSISDPDNTGTAVSFNTSGRFNDHDNLVGSQITYGSGASAVIFRYVPNTVTNLDIAGVSEVMTNYGKITLQMPATGGAPIPTHNRFQIAVNMTVPYAAQRIIRGFILANPNPSNANPPKLVFDSETFTLRGSHIDLEIPGFTFRTADPRPKGYEGLMASGNNTITGTISAPEPDRLLVKSTGYGPRGAKKHLEAIIQSNYFSGLGAPATITMVGPPSASNGNFIFDPGNSNAMLYSGVDQADGSSDVIPPIGVTGIPGSDDEDPNLQHVLAAVGGHIANNVQGVPANVRGELPPWMATPAEMDATIKNLYDTAFNSYDPTNTAGTGRYFASGTQPTSWGDNASGTGITFCDGDCELGPVAGGGLLIVTGQLTLHGNFSFNGLIIVTGGGGILRSGGGTGTIEGNIIVAPYLNSQIEGNLDPPANADFLAPKWNTQGGGNSDILYNSTNQNNSLGAISNRVLGVVEK